MADGAAEVNKKYEYGRKLLHRAAECNGLPLLRQLLSERTDDVDLRDKDNRTPLLIAATYNHGTSHYEFIKILLEHGADVNAQDEKGDTALHHVFFPSPAAKTVELLLSFNADVNIKNKKDRTPLANIVSRDNVEMVQLLVDHGADLNVMHEDGEAVLYDALRHRNKSVLLKLLSLGSNVNARNKHDRTCMHIAATESESDSHFEVIKVLLEHKANVNFQDENGKTPLHYLVAPRYGNPNIKTVELILSYEANVNLRDNDNKTPLTVAFKRGNEKIKKLLFDHGATANGKNEWYETALHKATRNNDASLVKRILSQKVTIDERDTYDRTSLQLAAFKCKYDWYSEVIQVLLKHKPDVNAQDKERKTPIHYLVMNPGNVKTVKLLLNCKVDINAKNSEGQTPLILSKDAEVVQLLVDRGADVNAKDDSGETALHKAAKNNSLPIIIKLVTLGAEVNILDSRGKTALHLATEENRVDSHYCIIEKLLKNGADVNVSDNSKRTPLYNLVKSNSSIETIELLLNSKADVDAEHHARHVPLVVAAINNNHDIVELLVDIGADINRRAEFDGSALWVAARQNNVSLIQKLLSLGADVNSVDEYDFTTLHIAAYYNNNVSQPETVEILLKNGTDINAQNIYGNTPLNHSFFHPVDTRAIETLLKFNADVNIKSKEGVPPIFKAIRNCRNSELVRLLVDHGSDLDYVDPKEKRTLLHEACKTYNFCTIEMLLKNGADVNAKNCKGRTPIYTFVEADFKILEYVKLLLNYNSDVNVKDDNGESPLSVALLHSNEDMVKFLVDHGADVNSPVVYWKTTPLHMACRRNFTLGAIELMLKKGADVDAKNEEGKTPIFHVLKEGNVEKIKLLLYYKPDVRVQDNKGKTPFCKALDYDNFEALQLLIDYDIKGIEFRSEDGSTFLHRACQYSEDIRVIELLLKKGAKVNARNNLGRTPLHCSISDNTDVTVEKLLLLLSYEADVTVKDSDGRIPLFEAVAYSNFNACKILIDHGSDVNSVDKNVSTPMHEACSPKYVDYLDVEIVKYLLKNGANIEAIDSEDRIPIMQSFSHKSSEVLKFLLKYSDVNTVDSDGDSILYLGQPANIERILLEHFAMLQVLNVVVHPDILDAISFPEEYYGKYYENCIEELNAAKSCKIKNSWITCFCLLVGSKKQLKNYCGNKDLVKDFKKNDYENKFSIYGEQMKKKLEKGLKRRELYDKSSVLLSDCLPIFNPTHLIVRDTLDCITTKELLKLSE